MVPRPTSQHHATPVSPRGMFWSLLPTPSPRLADETSATMPRKRRPSWVLGPMDPQFLDTVLPTQRDSGPGLLRVQPVGPRALACHHLHHSPAPPGPLSPAWAAVSPLQSGLFMACAREAHSSGAEVASAACTWQELRTVFLLPSAPQPGPQPGRRPERGHLLINPTPGQRGPHPASAEAPCNTSPGPQEQGLGAHPRTPAALSWLHAQWAACATLPCATLCCRPCAECPELP